MQAQFRRLGAAGQLHDRCAGRGQFVAMGARLLADFHKMLALLHKLSADDTVDKQGVAVRIVAPDLALGLLQKTVIAHPIGDMVSQPGTALRAVVISAGCAHFEGECLIPMNTLRTVWNVETIPDAQARVLRLHLPGELVRADVKTAPALRIANEAGDRHRAFHHAWERLTLLHVLPISRGRAANFLRLVYFGEL